MCTSITKAVLEYLPQNLNNFLKKIFKKIFLDPSLCNCVRLKSLDKLSVNIDHVYCTKYNEIYINIRAALHFSPIKYSYHCQTFFSFSMIMHISMHS